MALARGGPNICINLGDFLENARTLIRDDDSDSILYVQVYIIYIDMAIVIGDVGVEDPRKIVWSMFIQSPDLAVFADAFEPVMM